MNNSCSNLINNINTKLLTNAIENCQRYTTNFTKLINDDLNSCSEFMNKKAQTYATIDETLSQQLSQAEDIIDQISFD